MKTYYIVKQYCGGNGPVSIPFRTRAAAEAYYRENNYIDPPEAFTPHTDREREWLIIAFTASPEGALSDAEIQALWQ